MRIEKEKFETFDALRFFSFLLVFIFHLPAKASPLNIRGDVGVWFFFSLSGFLITYLLLIEKKNYTTIDLKKYFIRRSLKIWPLYFVALGIAFVFQILYSINGSGNKLVGYNPNWLISGLFLENYRILYTNLFSRLPIIPVLWSLCVEEHFYIIWGLVLKYSKSKNLPIWIVILLITAYIFKYIYTIHNLLFVDILSNFDYFMYGAIPAYLYVNYKEWITKLIHQTPFFAKLSICIGGIVYILSSPYFDFNFKEIIEPVILGLFFLSIILITLPKDNRFKISNSNIFSRIGIYTYGLYIYHSLVINLFYIFLIKSGIQLEKITLYIVVFFTSLLITIVVSILSYKYIESPFLRLKSKFQV